MPQARSIHARAHAKLNLALAVGPARAQDPHAGYHPIASWMHAVDLCDAVTLSHAARTTYDLAWDDGRALSWPAESDLSVRAHRAAEALAGRPLPVTLRVRKSIPAGGGMGGGSADAACVLLALRDLFGLDLDGPSLLAAAHALGTDVPFFLDPTAWDAEQPPRPAIVTGLGDRIERAPRRADPVTLVLPPFGCPTGAVYQAYDARPGPCDEARVRALADGPIDPSKLFNELAAPAEHAEPRLGALRRAVSEAIGVPVLVSGSGSTLFCFADAGAVRPHAPGCVVIATRLA